MDWEQAYEATKKQPDANRAGEHKPAITGDFSIMDTLPHLEAKQFRVERSQFEQTRQE